MTKFAWVLLVGVMFGCSDTDKSEYQSACVEGVPPEIEQRNRELAVTANAARLAAAKSERERLGASPLTLLQIILLERRGEGIVDPFPEAAPVHLDTASQEKYDPDRYAQFHGYDGARTVYETKPGSKQYFIVDEVYGDGAGSAALKLPPSESGDGTMHSWHATTDNRLVRVKPSPQYETVDRVAVCGCGPGQYQTYALDMARPMYPFGIFMLPGEQVPTMHADEMILVYVDQSVEIKYVPKKGKRCESPVC